MKILFSFVVLLVLGTIDTENAPHVQVYTERFGGYGEANYLVCHVSGFYPPEIKIRLLRDTEELPGAEQSALAYDPDWHYHLTKSVAFTPEEGEVYTCHVQHTTTTKNYTWGADM